MRVLTRASSLASGEQYQGERSFARPTGAVDLATVVRGALSTVPLDVEGRVEVECASSRRGLEIELSTGNLAIRSVVARATMTIYEYDMTVGSSGIPELILRSLDGMFDRVIIDRDLQRFVIRPDGTVEALSDGNAQD